MLKRLWGESEPVTFFAAAAVGVLLGVLLTTISQQTGLLEDLYILAHEQRRLLMASVQRELAAAAANGATKEPSKEPSTDA